MSGPRNTKSYQRESGTTTATPNVPGWLATPYQNFAGQVGGFQNLDPSAFAVGAAPLQTQAFGSAQSMGPNANIGGGIDMTRALQNFNPDRVSTTDVTTPLLSETDLSGYMNPYTSSVIDASLADLMRQRDVAITGNQAAATQAGSYGGSRHGIVDVGTNEAALREGGMLSAGLRAQNFAQAQAAAMADLQRRASLGDANAQRQLQAQMANQQAGLQGQQLNLGAADQLARLGLMSDENIRAIIGQQAGLGETQRGIDFSNNPALLRLMQMEKAGGLLGQIPYQAFTPITEQRTGTATGKGSTASPIWSLFG